MPDFEASSKLWAEMWCTLVFVGILSLCIYLAFRFIPLPGEVPLLLGIVVGICLALPLLPTALKFLDKHRIERW